MKIDGVTVLDYWLYGREWVTTTATMSQGNHTIVVEAFEIDGWASAVFQYMPLSFDLSVSKSGTGNGIITSSPVGIDCGTICSASFDYNSSFTLNAAPASDSGFSGWGGDCTVSSTDPNSCTTTMGSAKSVVVIFTRIGPLTPSNFRVKDTTMTSITISWDDVSNEDGYKIYKLQYINNVWGYYYFTSVGVNLTSFTDTRLPIGSGNHFYEVSAYSSLGESARSDWVGGGCATNGTCSIVNGSAQSSNTAFNLHGNPPSIPTLLAPKNKALTIRYRPRLDWSNSSIPSGTAFQKYVLQQAKDISFTNPISVDVNGSAKNSEYTLDIDLEPNTTYYWRVCAYNTQDEYSNWSSIHYFRTAVRRQR